MFEKPLRLIEHTQDHYTLGYEKSRQVFSEAFEKEYDHLQLFLQECHQKHLAEAYRQKQSLH